MTVLAPGSAVLEGRGVGIDLPGARSDGDADRRGVRSVADRIGGEPVIAYSGFDLDSVSDETDPRSRLSAGSGQERDGVVHRDELAPTGCGAAVGTLAEEHGRKVGVVIVPWAMGVVDEVIDPGESQAPAGRGIRQPVFARVGTHINMPL